MKIHAISQHRNGQSGAPFMVAIIEDPAPDYEGKYLYISFSHEYYNGCVAVLPWDSLIQGDIYFSSIWDENLEHVGGWNGQDGPEVGYHAEDTLREALAVEQELRAKLEDQYDEQEVRSLLHRQRERRKERAEWEAKHGTSPF